MCPRVERGQSTVETALLLPVVVLMAATVLHVGVVVRDHLAFWRTAGAAARIASIAPDDEEAVQSFVDGALGLNPTTVEIEHLPEALLLVRPRLAG